MKTDKPSKIAFIAIAALAAMSPHIAALSQSVTPNTNFPPATRKYIPVPVDMGELGRQDRYERPTQFWGDDPISQGGQDITDKIGRGIDEYRRKLNLNPSQSTK